MEIVLYVIKFAAIITVTFFGTAWMIYGMDRRGFRFNKPACLFHMTAVAILLMLCGGFSLWTVKGIAMAMIFLYASVQDASTHEADDFLWVMLLLLALVNTQTVGVWSMLLGGLVVFVPQMLVAMFSKERGVGGADIKVSTAAALSLRFLGGAIGLVLGLMMAIIYRMVIRKGKDARTERFALLPFITTGLMIGYFI